MAASPPAPMPMRVAAKAPAAKLSGAREQKHPRGGDQGYDEGDAAPKKRSKSQPTPILPRMLEPPRMEAHSAASAGVIPRSVSNADIWVIAPFMLIELDAQSTATIIQKA